MRRMRMGLHNPPSSGQCLTAFMVHRSSLSSACPVPHVLRHTPRAPPTNRSLLTVCPHPPFPPPLPFSCLDETVGIMPVYEQRHFVRVLESPNDIAKNFSQYCRRHQVLTRGLCRIGFVTRRRPVSQDTQNPIGAPPGGGISAGRVVVTQPVKIRGLIANKDIPKDDNVAMMSARACLTPATALANPSFMSIIPAQMQEQYFLVPRFVQNSRVLERSLIRHNQLLLALYLSYLMLLRQLRPQVLQAPENALWADAIDYVNFLPRMEGDFEQLYLHLAGWLDGAEVCRTCQGALAEHFNVTQAEVRPVLLYALAMIYSRMVPVDHLGLLKFAFKDTPLRNTFDNPSMVQPAIVPPAGVALSAASALVKEPISFLCPIIDMCNHSGKENVAVMVPERTVENPDSGPVICLRSLRDITKGEELTMAYGASERELRLIWGMQDILL